MELTKNKELLGTSIRKYQNIAGKFKNNVTLSSEEMKFLIDFSRKISACTLSTKF